MTSWAILGIATVLALITGTVWWFLSDARRSRAHRRLSLDIDDGEGDAPDTGWSVAAIAARVNQERGASAPRWPQHDADAPTTPLSSPRPHETDHNRPHHRPDNLYLCPPQRTAARQRPYINPRRGPQHPPPDPRPPATTAPTLDLLQRVRQGLENL